MAKKAYHGGAFFNAIGNEFATLNKANKIISADVLDAWFDPSPRVLSKIKAFLSFSLKTSPPTQCEGLVKAIAKKRKIPAANLLVGGGSSDLLFVFFTHMLKGGESVMILDPTYGEYAHILEHVTRSKIVRHRLKKENDFKINYTALSNDLKSIQPDLLILVNPNSPTGQYWDKENIVKLTRLFPKIIFVVDETYIEYIESGLSLEKESIKSKNLVIIKSMSKVYALSGARVGYLTANKKLIDKVAQFIPPWSVSLVAQIAAVEALKDTRYYTKRYKETHRLRQGMIKELTKIKTIKIYDSVANFILIELLYKEHKANAIIAELRRKYIYLRDCSSMSAQFKNNFIRIAIKNKENNLMVIEALKKIL